MATPGLAPSLAPSAVLGVLGTARARPGSMGWGRDGRGRYLPLLLLFLHPITSGWLSESATLRAPPAGPESKEWELGASAHPAPPRPARGAADSARLELVSDSTAPHSTARAPHGHTPSSPEHGKYPNPRRAVTRLLHAA